MAAGNEDGIKHCTSNVLYSLQHVGNSIRPRRMPGGLVRPDRDRAAATYSTTGPGPDSATISPTGIRRS